MEAVILAARLRRWVLSYLHGEARLLLLKWLVTKMGLGVGLASMEAKLLTGHEGDCAVLLLLPLLDY